MKRQKQDKEKIILGVTGSFGSGKTSVAGILKSFGATVINADEIVHQLSKPKKKIYKKIIRTFGKSFLKKNGTINRNKLAQIVFSNKKLLKKLNAIIHPEVIKVIKNQIKSPKAKIIVLDAPLLIEAGLKPMVDKLIVVTISRKEQINRLQNKLGLSKRDIIKRIRAQIPLQYKICLADFVIDNNGTIEKTRKQIERIRRSLWKN